jgi:hypothetical protein
MLCGLTTSVEKLESVMNAVIRLLAVGFLEYEEEIKLNQANNNFICTATKKKGTTFKSISKV